MTNSNASQANNETRSGSKLCDCQHDATVLAGMLEAIDLMGNEGAIFDNARISVTIEALTKAKKLADDLDRVKS